MPLKYLSKVKEELEENKNSPRSKYENKSRGLRAKTSDRFELSKDNLIKMEKEIYTKMKSCNENLTAIENMMSDNQCLQITFKDIFIGKQKWVKNKSQSLSSKPFINILQLDVNHIDTWVIENLQKCSLHNSDQEYFIKLFFWDKHKFVIDKDVSIPSEETRKLYLNARIKDQKLYCNNDVISKFGRIIHEVAETLNIRKVNFEKITNILLSKNNRSNDLDIAKLPCSLEITVKLIASRVEFNISESSFDNESEQICNFHRKQIWKI